jgi:hypothetical protein
MTKVTWILNGKSGSWLCLTAERADKMIAVLKAKGATMIAVVGADTL